MPRSSGTVRASIIKNGKTAENVTVDSVAWSDGDNGTITLSAAPPASVQIGDTITDSASNSYIITGIAGAVLTCQDFDSATNPATGSGTIQEAYQTITLWRADHDDTIAYRSGDIAQGDLYKSGGTFVENVVLDLGETVGLSKIILTVPTTDRHDGNVGTGVKLQGGIFHTALIDCTIEWLEVDTGDGHGGVRADPSTTSIISQVNNCLIHDISNSSAAKTQGLIAGDRAVVYAFNNLCWNYTQTGSGARRGIGISSGSSTRIFKCNNNSVHNIVCNAGTGVCYGIRIFADHANKEVQNNVVTDSSGSTTGTIQDYDFSTDTNMDAATNASSDSTAPSAIASEPVVSTTEFESSTNLLLKSGAECIDAGTDLGVTNGVNIDIKGRDRDFETDVWDVGGHELVAATVGSLVYRRPQGLVHR